MTKYEIKRRERNWHAATFVIYFIGAAILFWIAASGERVSFVGAIIFAIIGLMSGALALWSHADMKKHE